MKKGFFSVLTLFLVITALAAGADQSKKVYELIYKDLQRLTQHVLDLEKKIEQNREDIASLRTILEELLSLSRRFQAEQASMKEDQRQIPPQFQVLTAKLDNLDKKLIAFSGELTEIKKIVSAPPEALPTEQTEKQAAQEPPPEKKATEQKTEKETQTEEQEETPPGTQKIPQLSPQEVYNIAYTDYLKGNYPLAIDGFKLYLEQFADSPLADDAAYWIGECYFSQRQFEEAATQFTELILNYPAGDKIPAAYLKKGLSFLELDKKEEALSVFKLLISKFPYEEETKIAQEKIKEIR